MSEHKIQTLMPFPWQKDQWQTVMKQFELSRVPHGLLMQGLPGLGKKHFALAFAQTIMCLKPVNQVACGDCKSCKLLITDNHPDFLFVEPESEGKAIKIDQIRELVLFVSKTAQQGGYKCIVIAPADAMNDNARNALLKSLEEPQGDTIIVLVSSHPSRLSATIKSRCQNIKFAVPSEKVALEWLTPQVGVDVAPVLLKEAYGAPLAALEAYKNDLPAQVLEFKKVLNDVISGFQIISDGAKQVVGIGALKTIDFLLSYLEVLAKENISLPESVSKTNHVLPAKTIDFQLLFRFRDKVLELKKLVLSSANPNPQLIWEELLMDWIALNRMSATTHPKKQGGR